MFLECHCLLTIQLLCATVKQLESEWQGAINVIVTWMSSWRLQANVSKTRVLFLTDSASMFKFTFSNSPPEIQTVKEHKHLGECSIHPCPGRLM